MSDVREWVDGARTVRVYGLDAKATSVGTAKTELETLVSNGLRSGNDALAEWRGRHSETFVEDANDLLGKVDDLVQKLAKAKRTLTSWPLRPGRPPMDQENATGPRVEVPPANGTSAANPDKLDDFRLWCEDACARLPSLTGNVNLDGVRAEVTSEGPLLGGDVLFPPPYTPQGQGPLVTTADSDTTTTYTATPSLYVDLPEVSGRTTTVVELAGQLGAWTGAVALAFREGDERLHALIEDHPELADELLAGFADRELGGESSLVVLLAYFDVVDRDGDGIVSLEELQAAACNTDIPPYASGAAQYLMDNPQLRWLVDTMNNGMDYSSDIAGSARDDRISVEDITTFLELNDQLAVLEQNFDAFDTAAHPDDPADGEVSVNDLRAIADGDGQLAAAAQWLLDHPGALTRLAWYERAKPGFDGKHTGTQHITTDSLLLLTVDQQVYADRGDQAGSFVDRRFGTLMTEDFGYLASADGMGSVFDTALTTAPDRADLMQRVITEVGQDGAIHNRGLNVAFANGAAANMPVLDGNINALAGYGDGQAPDDLRENYLHTHDFLREVSKDPEAAGRLSVAVHDYGMTETATAADSGEARDTRLRELGRISSFVEVAQDNALTGEALDDLRESVESGLGPSMGSVTDYGISHVPVAGTLNDIADGMGISTGDGVDWLLSQMGEDSADAFDSLSEAERADRARRIETTLTQAVWLINDRYDTDPSLRDAARGQPFVDSSGAIKTDMTAGEAQAFREWATSMIAEGGPLVEDYDPLGRGSNEQSHPPHGVEIVGRR